MQGCNKQKSRSVEYLSYKTVKEFIDMLCEERVVKSVNAGGVGYTTNEEGVTYNFN